jgi:murein DD-endopeptidase MepM/ murein hydrolase activator NlpD
MWADHPEMRIAKKSPKTRVLATLMLGILFVATSHAAPAQHSAKAPPPAEASKCNGDLKLVLSAPQASQGTVLLADLRSTQPLTEITATWSDRKVYFWKTSDATKTGERFAADHRQALIGADLEKVPGAYQLAISAQTGGAAPAGCTATVAIRAGKFATESLKVDHQFVEPNEQQAQRAAAEQKKLRELYDTVTPEKLWQGPFQIPLTGATQGSNFGKRRILNGQPRSPHTGADFPALTGTPIHATQNGQVVLAEELYFSGNTVIIDHGLGVYSLYGHLSEIGVTAGEHVKAGAMIGKVGATGRVTGPHLHWGVVVNRARVNPVQLVSILRAGGKSPGPNRQRHSASHPS